MRRKDMHREVQNKQELANRMLDKSQQDLFTVKVIQSPIRDLMRRVSELNQENNFARRIAAAYAGDHQ